MQEINELPGFIPYELEDSIIEIPEGTSSLKAEKMLAKLRRETASIIEQVRTRRSLERRKKYLGLAEGHINSEGEHFPLVHNDQRLYFLKTSDPREIPEDKIGMIEIEDIVVPFFPGETLPCYGSGYDIGKIVAKIADKIFERQRKNARVAEMGVGSGVVMVSALKNSPNIHYIGIDIDGKALTSTELCLRLNGINRGRWEIAKGNVLSPLKHKRQYDVIVSNPPYYTRDENLRNKNVGPDISTFGGEDGLFFYKEILKGARRELRKGGYIVFRMPYRLILKVVKLAEKTFERDLNGKKLKVTLLPPSEKRLNPDNRDVPLGIVIQKP